MQIRGRIALVFLAAAVTALAQDDAWITVQQVESGTDLRIYKTGEKKPISGKMGQASDGNLMVVVKNGQESIDKDQIDRIDMRTEEPSTHVKEVRQPNGRRRQVTVHPKPHYTTIYRVRGTAER
jgi:hypothetical protein